MVVAERARGGAADPGQGQQLGGADRGLQHRGDGPLDHGYGGLVTVEEQCRVGVQDKIADGGIRG